MSSHGWIRNGDGVSRRLSDANSIHHRHGNILRIFDRDEKLKFADDIFACLDGDQEVGSDDGMPEQVSESDQ